MNYQDVIGIYPYLDKVGIEIEGGYELSSLESIKSHQHQVLVGKAKYQCHTVTLDGSLRLECECCRELFYSECTSHFDNDGSRCPCTELRGKEIVSYPFPVATALDRLDVWVREHYPTTVNSSCGIHVHISTPHYQLLLDPLLTEYLIQQLELWGKRASITNNSFWTRLGGSCHFCAKAYDPHSQIYCTGKSGGRYTMINYCHSLHGTVEIRVLPAFKQSKIAVSAIHVVLSTVNKFIQYQLFRGDTVQLKSQALARPITGECIELMLRG